MIFPIAGNWQISQLFKTGHDAWDIISIPDRNKDLVASFDGIMERSQANVFYKGYVADQWVRIRFTSGELAGWTFQMHHTMIGHRVKAGTVVKAGQKIARINNSGKSSGDHVHLIVTNPQGKRVTPYTVFKKYMYYTYKDKEYKSTSPRTYFTYYTKPTVILPPVDIEKIKAQAKAEGLKSGKIDAVDNISTAIAKYKESI